MTDIPLNDVRVIGRHRKHLGDLRPLADSIAAIGLLHPIVLRPDNSLVVGERRLAAFRLLKRTTIPANIASNLSELGDLLRAEADENTCRKDFTPEEAVAVGAEIEKAYKPVAVAAQRQSPGRPKKGRGTSPKISRKETESARTTAVAVAAAPLAPPEKAPAAKPAPDSPAVAKARAGGIKHRPGPEERTGGPPTHPNST